MRATATIGIGLLFIAACSGSPGTTPIASPQTASPGATASAGVSSAPATPTPPASVQPTPAQPPGATGGLTGPVFTGTLAQAFPPVIAGQPVQVFGPVPAPEMDNLDASTLALIDQLGFDPSTVEVAFASDSGASALIFALRFPGVDATTLDATYLSIQEAAPGTTNFRVVSVAGRNVRAFDSIIGTTYAWVNGDILFTVFGDEQGAQQAIAAMPLPTVALQPGGEVLPDALVDVTLTGGSTPGSYHGETSSGGCSRNALGENQFGLQYSDDDNPDGLTSFQLIVRDAAAAESGGTDDFLATIQIGPAFSGTTHELHPSEGDGSGTITISSTDVDKASVVISAVTADGVTVQATVTCNVVFGFGD